MVKTCHVNNTAGAARFYVLHVVDVLLKKVYSRCVNDHQSSNIDSNGGENWASQFKTCFICGPSSDV